jgi:phosphatidylglycerophosphate synthase
MTELSNRRPLKSREAGWARGLARDLARAGVSPDQISFFSFAFAFMGACAFAASSQAFGGWRALLLILAAAGIQLRLVCNLLDGLVAVEHGKGGPHGPIWNELPDRFSDAVLMVGAGLGAGPVGEAWGAAFGAACALLAVLTAYVRELGRGLGFPADFSGPMAKPQRMALLTAAALVSATEELWHGRGWTLLCALGLLAALTALTVARRVARLARALERRAGEERVREPREPRERS